MPNVAETAHHLRYATEQTHYELKRLGMLVSFLGLIALVSISVCFRVLRFVLQFDHLHVFESQVCCLYLLLFSKRTITRNNNFSNLAEHAHHLTPTTHLTHGEHRRLCVCVSFQSPIAVASISLRLRHAVSMYAIRLNAFCSAYNCALCVSFRLCCKLFVAFSLYCDWWCNPTTPTSLHRRCTAHPRFCYR